MAAANITISAVKALASGGTIWDADHREAVRGFGVRKQQSVATYVLKYRFHGQQRFYTIGAHGSPWTPDAARREAKKLLGKVAEGKDPADDKRQTRLQDADTLGRLVDQYLKHAERKQKPRSFIETKRHLQVAWKPLHRRSMHVIRRSNISARLAEIAENQGPVAANHARAALSALFNWAIAEGYDIPANPVLGTNRPVQPKARDRVLTDTELSEIWRACGDDDYSRIVRLLILTAQRRDEVGGMLWSELDFAAARWTIPGIRTKNHREHVLPLTPAALALLPPRRNDREHVFGNGPRRSGDRQRGFSGWSKGKAELDARILAARNELNADAEPPPRWTVHDLRRTGATIMADRLGVLPHVVEAMLNHVSGHRAGVAGVYNRALYSAEMRDALERWAEYVAALTKPRPKSLRLVRVEQRSPITGS